MATHTVYIGESWPFGTTLTDDAGDAITSLGDAWFEIYTSAGTVVVEKELADSEMTLASNILSTTILPTETDDITAGTYYLDIKVETSGGIEQVVTARDRVRVKATPTSNNH